MQDNIEKSKQALKLRKEFGQLIKDIRIDKGYISLNEFALSFGINRANLSKIENGKVGCSILTAWRISEALGLKLSDIIKQIEDKTGKKISFLDF